MVRPAQPAPDRKSVDHLTRERCPVCGVTGYRSVRREATGLRMTCRAGHPYYSAREDRRHYVEQAAFGYVAK